MDTLSIIPKNLMEDSFESIFKGDDFSQLPIEIHREIALACGNDRDIAKYSLLNRDTYSAVNGHGGIWRARFAQVFDYPEDAGLDGLTSKIIELEYKRRVEIIAKTVNWPKYSVKNMVHLLIKLIRETYNTAPGQEVSSVPEGKNLKPIFELVRKLDILNNFGNFAPSQIRNVDLPRNAVQLLLFPWTLDRTCVVWGYEESRDFAFSEITRELLYYVHADDDVVINHLYLLYICNFFAKHCSPHTGYYSYLAELYKGLEDCSKPKLWSHKLKQGLQPFGTKWLGMSGRMAHNDLAELWNDHLFSEADCPALVTMEAFDECNIQMSDHNDSSAPTLNAFLESCLRSLPPKDLLPDTVNDTEPGVHYLPFHGHGIDGDRKKSFELVGNIYTLPEQAHIPGWQHISFLKFFPNAENRGEKFGWLKFTTLDEVQDQDCELWACEGIMTPGNKVIVGRWFKPEGPRPDNDDECWFNTGPSLMWCIDVSEAEREKKECKTQKRQAKIEIVHNTTSPDPKNLPKPVDAELNFLSSKTRKERKKFAIIQALVPDNIAPHDLRLPPPSMELMITKSTPLNERRKKSKGPELFKTEGGKEPSPTPFELKPHALATPPSSARTPRQQYFQMRDLTEVDSEEARVAGRLIKPEKGCTSNSKSGRKRKSDSKPKEQPKPKKAQAKKEESCYESDLELIKQQIAKTSDYVEKAAWTVRLFRRAKEDEMYEDDLQPELQRFDRMFGGGSSGTSIFRPIRDEVIHKFRERLNDAMEEIEQHGKDLWSEGKSRQWARAQSRVLEADYDLRGVSQ